ncbi:MAG: winged helix-turn-helix transcriptional regulator [Actinomycetia bacterium]|nr:winged helix-turn-helix transcriptional regulator [Actinomycetes bacterium]MCP4963532.1 winged helix-turn-helix transcriptional regulator [Actinomycetes bacterium]
MCGVDVQDERFRALANRSRRRLLVLVRDEERSVGGLASELDVSQPATSQHLAVLRDAGLVDVRVDGRRRLYRANTDQVAAAQEFFDEYWSSSLDRLAAAAEQTAKRRNISS